MRYERVSYDSLSFKEYICMGTKYHPAIFCSHSLAENWRSCPHCPISKSIYTSIYDKVCYLGGGEITLCWYLFYPLLAEICGIRPCPHQAFSQDIHGGCQKKDGEQGAVSVSRWKAGDLIFALLLFAAGDLRQQSRDNKLLFPGGCSFQVDVVYTPNEGPRKITAPPTKPQYVLPVCSRAGRDKSPWATNSILELQQNFSVYKSERWDSSQTHNGMHTLFHFLDNIKF